MTSDGVTRMTSSSSCHRVTTDHVVLLLATGCLSSEREQKGDDLLLRNWRRDSSWSGSVSFLQSGLDSTLSPSSWTKVEAEGHGLA